MSAILVILYLARFILEFVTVKARESFHLMSCLWAQAYVTARMGQNVAIEAIMVAPMMKNTDDNVGPCRANVELSMCVCVCYERDT